MVPRPASEVRRESTSIKIRPDLWKEAKIEAIRRDMDLSELVENALEQYIESEARKLATKGGRHE